MSKYAGREYKKYALLAGFTEIGETLEETVSREVMEEVGLKVKNITYYKNQPWAFSDTLLMGFFCELDGSDQVKLDENHRHARPHAAPEARRGGRGHPHRAQGGLQAEHGGQR